jgi:hypothetical protein
MVFVVIEKEIARETTASPRRNSPIAQYGSKHQREVAAVADQASVKGPALSEWTLVKLNYPRQLGGNRTQLQLV